MAAPAPTPAKPTAPEAETPVAEAAGTPRRGGMFWKLAAAGFIAAVIGAECLVTWIYLSSSSPSPESEGHGDEHGAASGAAAADAHGAKDEHGGHSSGHGSEHGSGHGKGAAGGVQAVEKEVDLGEYSITAFQGESNTTLLINFHLYGTIAIADDPAFLERYEGSKHRIRDQVIVTIRSAELTDLTDPGLGLIKRQILDKINRGLGKSILQGVIFSDFLLVEQ